MWRALLTEIYNLRWLIVIYVVFIFALIILSLIVGKKFVWNGRNTTIYGFFYNLNTHCKIAYGISLTRVLYVMINAVFCEGLGFEVLIVLMLQTIFISVFSRDFLILPGQVFIYGVIFGILMLEGMFSGYYNEVDGYWLIRVMVIFLGTFVSLYVIYHQIIIHERLVNISAGEKQLKGVKSDFGATISDFAHVFGIGRKTQAGESLVDMQKND